MSLAGVHSLATRLSFPRVSGDEPSPLWSPVKASTFSPRERG